ncbi:MAG: hypothetical protein K8R21_08325 [Leptospira sp.]|nr:hypothetical protein [Leptospira sp.]
MILQFFYYKSEFISISDVPNERSMHTASVKKAAGIFFVSVFIIAALILLPVSLETLFIISGSVFCLLLGFADDILNLSSFTKLIAEFMFFIPFSGYFCGNCRIFGIDPGLIGIFAPVLVAFYFVFVINLCNFMDGIDFYLVLTFFVSMVNLIILGNFTGISANYLILFSASFLGFAILNYPPAKLFMGDSGSLPVGFLLASLPFFINTPSTPDLSMSILLIPVFWTDGVITIVSRYIQGKNILQAHREHLYQRISLSIFSKRTTSVLFGLINLSAAGSHFVLKNYLTTTVSILLLLTVFAGLYFIANSRIQSSE